MEGISPLLKGLKSPQKKILFHGPLLLLLTEMITQSKKTMGTCGYS